MNTTTVQTISATFEQARQNIQRAQTLVAASEGRILDFETADEISRSLLASISALSTRPAEEVLLPAGAHSHFCWHHHEKYICRCAEANWIHRLCDSCEIRLGRNTPQHAAPVKVAELPEPELSDEEEHEFEMLLTRDHDDSQFWTGGSHV